MAFPTNNGSHWGMAQHTDTFPGLDGRDPKTPGSLGNQHYGGISPFQRSIMSLDTPYSDTQTALVFDAFNQADNEKARRSSEASRDFNDNMMRRSAQGLRDWHSMNDKTAANKQNLLASLLGGIGNIFEPFSKQQPSALTGLMGDFGGGAMQFRNNMNQPIGGMAYSARPSSSMYGYAS